ncbi:alpha/beta fold hydrolase [Candidatus Saccharibacteria bacterium]|nr:alpha/beta fold hydrolase [Candidatus Saccharibacteria bacterium]
MRFEYLWHGILGRPYRLHVEHHGDRSKPAVVLLHGIAASGDDWQKVIRKLEPEYHCITIDLLGFGQSPKPIWADYTMQDHMRSLFHTMNKLRLHRKFILIGHSLGSFLAARYATEHEANLDRLLLLSPPVYPPLGSIPTRLAKHQTDLLLKLYRFIRKDPRMTPETFRKIMYLTPLPRTIVTNPDTWTPFMRTLKQCIEKQTVLSDVAQLRLPVDVCYGTLDQVVVNANVELLGKYQTVRLHQFLNDHDLTTRYGKLVSDILAAPTR